MNIGHLLKLSLVGASFAAILFPLAEANAQPQAQTTTNSGNFQSKAPRLKAKETAPAQQTVKTETTTFDTWTVTCNVHSKDVKGEDGCIARTNVVKSADDPQPVLYLIVVKNEAGERMLVQTPSSIKLGPGTKVQFGDNKVLDLKYSSCEPALCTADMTFDSAIADQMKTSEKASVLWTSLTLGEIKVEFALAGARAAIEYLAKK